MLLATDRQLLDRFRRGDRHAMGQVFDHYSDGLQRFLGAGFLFQSAGRTMRFAGVHDRCDLHDLVAETFRRAFEERARLAYDGLSAYDLYLRTVARNLVIDRLRTQRASEARQASLKAVEEGSTAEPRLSPEERYLRAELGRLIDSFRGDLDAPERRLLALRYEEGLSQEELAARLGRTRGWVRGTERDLRRRLLAHLKGTGYLPAPAGSR